MAVPRTCCDAGMQRLQRSTCSALPSLQVLSQRRPWVYRLLAYEDEVFALVAAILDHSSLASAGGTFSESLYGLRRAPAERDAASAATHKGCDAGSSAGSAAGQGQEGAAAPMLTHRQRRAALLLSVSVLAKTHSDHLTVKTQHVQSLHTRRDSRPVPLLIGLQVLLPYAHAKLSALYDRHSSAPRSLALFDDPVPAPGLLPPAAQQDQAQQQQQQQGAGQERHQRPLQRQFQQLDVRLGGGLSSAAARLQAWQRYLRTILLHAFVKVTAPCDPREPHGIRVSCQITITPPQQLLDRYELALPFMNTERVW